MCFALSELQSPGLVSKKKGKGIKKVKEGKFTGRAPVKGSFPFFINCTSGVASLALAPLAVIVGFISDAFILFTHVVVSVLPFLC